MIIDFSVENFTSIKEKITFSLEAMGTKKLLKNIIKGKGSKSFPTLLKGAVIYGANASGKTNIIKAMAFIKHMVINSHNFNVDVKIPRVPYKFEEGLIEKPSKFEINFIHENIRYRYGFSCNEKSIEEEYLYYWPSRKEALIFKRDSSGNFTFNSEKSQQEVFAKQTTPNVLYISRATQLGYIKTKPVYDFFSQYIVINLSSTLEATIRAISENSTLKDKFLEILQRADFGGVGDINIRKEIGKVRELTFNGTEVSQKESEKEIYNLEFLHKTKNKIVPLSFVEESAGTQKTFSMLGPIFDVLEQGKVLIVDELESSLHPKISQFIVKLFSSKHNINNAQLIFSTHDTQLLDNSLFRKDQIYFCEKKPNEWTEIVSMQQFDIRQEADFEKAYREGRFGAVPFIDETYLG